MFLQSLLQPLLRPILQPNLDLVDSSAFVSQTFHLETLAGDDIQTLGGDDIDIQH